MAFFLVHRFAGPTAIIVSDDGREFEVPRRALPDDADEGAVLRLNLEHPVTGDWSAAAVDAAERARRGNGARS